MFRRFKTEIYTYYKMGLLAVMSIAGLVLMGQSETAQNILSGLAIFLLGMVFLEDGFKGFSGGILEKILKKFSDTKLKSILFGLSATAIMQSSTLVTILTLSFLSASLVGLGQALGIVFGANIGSTTSGWIIAGIGVKMNVSALGLPLITLGVMLLFAKSKNLKSLGYILAGIGFFFLGISYIKIGFESYQNFDLSAISSNKVWAFAIFFGMGILITSIVQSSFAALTIIILALSTGSISYDDALALVIGTNVGGVVTALIASISSSVDGRRLAIGNTLFNLVIAVVCIIFLPWFKEAVDILAGFFGFGESDYALKIALFHTTYNVIAVAMMTPFIPLFERFLCSFITTSKDDSDYARYIDFDLIPYPNTAKECLQKEVLHLFDNTIFILGAVIGASKQELLESRLDEKFFDSPKRLKINADELENLYEKKIKNIFNAIIDFSTHLRTSYDDDKAFCAEIANLQKASRNLVEATKNLKIIKPNIIKNSAVSNKTLQQEYTNIRVLLAQTIYDLKILQDENLAAFDATRAHKPNRAQNIAAQRMAGENIQEGIKHIKKDLKTINSKSIYTIQELIKSRKITSAQATSLLNDIAFSTEALKEIVNAANCIVKYENLLLANNASLADPTDENSMQNIPLQVDAEAGAESSADSDASVALDSSLIAESSLDDSAKSSENPK